MPTIKPRVNVVLNPSDAECLQLICDKRQMSMSGLIRKVVEEWLEDYEDELLSRRAIAAEEEWIKDGCKTITHEELCKELGIKSNINQNPEKSLLNYPKTPVKGSFETSKKSSHSRRKMASH